MSTVITTAVKTEPTTDTLTIGATGDSVVISGDSLNLNTLQDAGGNTIFESDGAGKITSSNFPGAMTLVSSTTALNAESISFSLDSTYDVYMFTFATMRPETNSTFWHFQCRELGGSAYATTITSTFFVADHTENGTTAELAYTASGDQAQGTAYERLNQGTGTSALQACSGELFLYAPSSTTFVKHFYGRVQDSNAGSPPQCSDNYSGGYLNTTTALDSINFKFSSGNIASGTVSMYGIKKS